VSAVRRCDSQITADRFQPLVLTSPSSYVAFTSLGVGPSVQFTLRLRTRSPAGLVAHCAGRTRPVADRVLLTLAGGRPTLTVNWGSGSLVVEGTVAVSDGRWHGLEVIVEPFGASLLVDGRRFDGRAHSDTNQLDLATHFYVGAAVSAGHEGGGGSILDRLRAGSRRAIVGCVDRVRIRGRLESWRTALSSSPDAATECVSDVFGCSGSACPATDRPDGQKPSEDSVDSLQNTTSLAVDEGGRALLSVALIRSISGAAVSKPDIRFCAATNQLHGRLSIADEAPDGDEIEFSSSDLAQSRVWYNHDGSETTSDTIRLYADGELVPLPVDIIPSNDAPVIRLPPNDTLTLVANTRIQLSGELLSASDADDASSSLEFNVYPSDDANRNAGYFELATSSGVRAKIARFARRDVEAGRVFFVHRGSATQSLLLDATDGKDTSGIKRLTVVARPLAVVPTVNAGSSVPRGGNVVIDAGVLSFATNAPYLALDIRYQVVEPPFYGELQKLVQYRAGSGNDDGDANRKWIVASSFTQTQLDESRVRYVHDRDSSSREDYFIFRVSAVGAGHRTETDEEYHFRLSVVECAIDAAATRPFFVQTVSRNQVITSAELRHASSLQRHRADDVEYRVRSAPRFGDLFVGRESDRKLNRRRRKLTSGDSFTQADVDGGRLTYRMYSTAANPVNDTIEFDVVTSCASLRRQVLLLRYRGPTTGSVRLINAGLANVREGDGAAIGPEQLYVETARDRARRYFRFSITEPPRHGALQLTQTGSRKGAVSKSDVSTFGVEDIASGRLRYVHDDSETWNDSFLFSVTETISGDVPREPDVMFDGRFLIDIALQNDNVPRRAGEAVLEVVAGVGRRLGPEHLKYVDEDVDTARLEFTWRPPDVDETVVLAMTDDPGTPMYAFTQADVDSGGVYAHHRGGRDSVVVAIWVSDGLHFVSGTLVVRASEPFVRAGNGSALAVVAGQSAIVSADNLGFATNIDASLDDIVFQVSSKFAVLFHSSQPAYLRSSLHACHSTRSLRLSNTIISSLLRLFAHHLPLAASALQPLKSGTLSLYLSVPVPVLTPSVVISKPTTASWPSNPLNPSPLAPQIRLC